VPESRSSIPRRAKLRAFVECRRPLLGTNLSGKLHCNRYGHGILKAVHNNIVLTVGGSQVLNVAMRVGQTNPTVEFKAELRK
jgi:hypothetical protein